LLYYCCFDDFFNVKLFYVSLSKLSRYLFKAFGISFQFREDTKQEKCFEFIAEASLENQIMFFIINKGSPFLFAIIATMAAYIKAEAPLKDEDNSLVEATKIEGARLLKYPLYQLILYTPAILVAIYQISHQDFSSVDLLRYLKSICCLGGFLTFMIYRKQKKRSNSLFGQVQISMQQHKEDSLGISFNTDTDTHIDT